MYIFIKIIYKSQIQSRCLIKHKYSKMRIAVIGAGVAGLASARRCLETGFEFTVYERTKRVGGTWVYDDRIGFDEFDLPIHTSMYKNLLYVLNQYFFIVLKCSFNIKKLYILGQIYQKN